MLIYFIVGVLSILLAFTAKGFYINRVEAATPDLALDGSYMCLGICLLIKWHYGLEISSIATIKALCFIECVNLYLSAFFYTFGKLNQPSLIYNIKIKILITLFLFILFIVNIFYSMQNCLTLTVFPSFNFCYSMAISKVYFAICLFVVAINILDKAYKSAFKIAYIIGCILMLAAVLIGNKYSQIIALSDWIIMTTLNVVSYIKSISFIKRVHKADLND